MLSWHCTRSVSHDWFLLNILFYHFNDNFKVNYIVFHLNKDNDVSLFLTETTINNQEMESLQIPKMQ